MVLILLTGVSGYTLTLLYPILSPAQETELLRGLNDFCEKPMVISQQESNGEPGQSGNWKLRPKTTLVVAVTIGMMDIR